MDSIPQSDDLVIWSELQDKNWVIFYGQDKYYIDEKTKNAIVDGVTKKLSIVVVDGSVWTDKFSRILPLSVVKEAKFLERGYKRSTKEAGKWYDPKVKPIEYFD